MSANGSTAIEWTTRWDAVTSVAAPSGGVRRSTDDNAWEN